MNMERIAELARGMARRPIYALIACTALAFASYSCNESPPLQQPTPPPTATRIAPTPVPVAPAPPPIPATPPTQQPTPPPTATAVAETPVPASPTPPRIESRPTPSPIPANPTPLPPIGPTPTSGPDSLPLPADAPFTQITAYERHTCGLQADGTALCWGKNINGSLNVPDGLAFRRISAGLNFACGLRRDGAIACWGNDNNGQASPPDGSFDEIAAGRAHACALDDGALICWGNGFPDGPETIQDIPPLSTIQAGAEFTCGLTPDADMACWSNRDSELAITPGPFTDIGIGLHHACAIRADRSVFCGESRHYSQRSSPPPTKFVQISAGWYHACGITESSAIECWGSGVPGATSERLSAPEGEFTAVSIGWHNSCALNPNGHAVCWRQPDLDPKAQSLDLTEAFGGVKFEQPMEVLSFPDGRLAVVERKGTIIAYSDEPNAAPPQTILDVTDKFVCCDYRHYAVMSAALDPQFEEFPFLYVHYRTTLNDPASGEDMPEFAGKIRLVRFRVEDGQAVRASELTILEVPQPLKWHYGGSTRFGPDGMLYMATGYNSVYGDAQSLETLNGKVIRIDVRGATPEQPYLVPRDNPFVNNPEARPEIWATGLRNPWRMGFAPDGGLFIGDVGDQTQEEISLATSGSNLGSRLCEGNVCQEGIDPVAYGLTAPVLTFEKEDVCAVIGGVTAPWLDNGFVFGDYCSGRVYLLKEDEQEGWQTRALLYANRSILSFGIDSRGTVYIMTPNNPIMRMRQP